MLVNDTRNKLYPDASGFIYGWLNVFDNFRKKQYSATLSNAHDFDCDKCMSLV